MSDRSAVIKRELEWHERDAHRRVPLDELIYDPPAFDSVVKPAIAYLGARPGERVLDIGCGEGKETYELAARGSCVVSIDLSYQQLSRAQQRVLENGYHAGVSFVQANAEALPFARGTFRIVYGKAIVHHLDGDLFYEELDRVIADEGRATFAEPMDRHPLVWLFRRFTPRLRTEDEHPMGVVELEQFARRFGTYEMSVHFLLSPLAYVLRLLPRGEGMFRKAHAFMQGVDNFLLKRVSMLRGLAWYGLVMLRKDP